MVERGARERERERDGGQNCTRVLSGGCVVLDPAALMYYLPQIAVFTNHPRVHRKDVGYGRGETVAFQQVASDGASVLDRLWQAPLSAAQGSSRRRGQKANLAAKPRIGQQCKSHR